MINNIENQINDANKAKSTNEKYSDNFNSVINNLAPGSNNKPWFKKKASIIAMSSTLGVGVLATVVAVPVALTSNSSSSTTNPDNPGSGPGGDIGGGGGGGTTPPSKPTTPQEAIANFNKQNVTTKLDAYNNFVTTNNSQIVTYIKGAGMGKFFDANVVSPVSTTTPNTASSPSFFTNFRNLISTSAIINGDSFEIIGTATSFLTIKGTANTNLLFINFDTSCQYSITNHSISNTSATTPTYTFFSPAKSLITNVTLKEDYSVEMTLSNTKPILSFYLIDNSVTNNPSLNAAIYKNTIVFNNSTLFPNMQESIKTKVLASIK